MPSESRFVRPIIRFKKLSQNAMTPSRGSEKAAGYDLFSAQDAHIPKCGKALINIDIQIQLPEGCYGRIAPRSGLSWKHHIDVGAGVIDEDYRGNIGVVLFNHGANDYEVKKGDRIAQLICERIFYPDIEEIKGELGNTKRGSGGFGSTDEVKKVKQELKQETKEEVKMEPELDVTKRCSAKKELVSEDGTRKGSEAYGSLETAKMELAF